jgi:CRISPR system Cascade subunit CasE
MALPRFYVVSKRSPQTPEWRMARPDARICSPASCRRHVLGAFDLRANPVVTISSGWKVCASRCGDAAKKILLAERGLARWQEWKGNDKPALYELVSDTCGQWLFSRGPRLGFEIVNGEPAWWKLMRSTAEKKGRLRFSTVDFSGVLRVTDSEAFSTFVRRDWACEGIWLRPVAGPCGMIYGFTAKTGLMWKSGADGLCDSRISRLPPSRGRGWGRGKRS